MVYIIMGLGGILMGLTVRRFLPIRKGWFCRFVPVLLFAVVLGLPSWVGDENPILLLPFFIVIFLLCYSGSWYARLIVGIIFYTLLVSLNMMLDSIPYYSTFIAEVHWEYLILSATKLLVWMVMWVAVQRFVPGSKRLVLVPRLWMLSGGLSLAPFFAVLSLTIWNAKAFDAKAYYHIVTRLAYTILPFTVLSALSLLVTLLVLSRHEELKQAQKAAEIQDVYYQGIKREQMEVRTLRHDLCNHITVAQSLLEQGDNNGAKRYLEELARSPALAGQQRYCENGIANAVLTNKAAVMEQEGIHTDLTISLPDRISIPDTELCALLGNALDNAIEAARTARDKHITVRARADKGMLMLQVENTVGSNPLRENGVFKTTKSDADAHGFGLAGMREIAERYGGSLEASVRQGRFDLIVCLPLPQEG